ncbi:hypothetical protein AMATHDRAFT_8503 [Amanita thiersii Skay4041]|uniref:Uncharacterized protein n=1 Tax=Amanita thiersii Skay4041 TaxID=703135 RepID=A0A2A9N858_9AGAR|nr:hypothetical protein AMATHDRAFT_8503 [Amanita thiersii Skay4041]
MSENDALAAIYELKNKPTIVHTSRNSQMDVKAVVSTTDTFQTFKVKALLDSRLYNADGTKNNIGSLTHKIQLQMRIGEHMELMDFSITNISKNDIFLGHDWLQHHNPKIDWKNAMLEFSQCPGLCRMGSEVESPEEESTRSVGWDEMDEGDHLLAVHIGPECKGHLSQCSGSKPKTKYRTLEGSSNGKVTTT